MMNNYDKAAVLFLGQIERRLDIKVVFVGFFTKKGGLRAIFYKNISNEYFFGTLFLGESPDHLNQLSKEAENFISRPLKWAFKEVCKTKKPIPFIEGRPIHTS
jgi:hypothetical protein